MTFTWDKFFDGSSVFAIGGAIFSATVTLTKMDAGLESQED